MNTSHKIFMAAGLFSLLLSSTAFSQSSGIVWKNGNVLTAQKMQQLDNSKMNISSLGKPGFAPKLNALGQITNPVVGDVSGATATPDGKTVSQISQLANGSVQQTDANQPNGYPKLDANGNVTASLVTVSALYGTDVTAAPTDTDTALYTLTPSGPTTVTLGANGSAGHQKMVELLITQPSSGGSVVTLAGTIFWPNSISPVISAVAGDKTFIRFMTVDGGKTYIGGI